MAYAKARLSENIATDVAHSLNQILTKDQKNVSNTVRYIVDSDKVNPDVRSSSFYDRFLVHSAYRKGRYARFLDCENCSIFMKWKYEVCKSSSGDEICFIEVRYFIELV
jgi:ribosomal protein S26